MISRSHASISPDIRGRTTGYTKRASARIGEHDLRSRSPISLILFAGDSVPAPPGKAAGARALRCDQLFPRCGSTPTSFVTSGRSSGRCDRLNRERACRARCHHCRRRSTPHPPRAPKERARGALAPMPVPARPVVEEDPPRYPRSCSMTGSPATRGRVAANCPGGSAYGADRTPSPSARAPPPTNHTKWSRARRAPMRRGSRNPERCASRPGDSVGRLVSESSGHIFSHPSKCGRCRFIRVASD